MKGIWYWLFLMMLGIAAQAQKPDKKEVGVRAAYGFRNEVLPEGKIYKPVMILPYYSYYFSKPERRLRFSGILEEQIVPVIADYNDNPHNVIEWEFGITAGPVISYKIDRFMPYIGGTFGVNYITVETNLQKNGWIFSDNAFSGLKLQFKNNIYGDLHFRIRHISNGGAKDPNLGIDNWVLGLGISKIY